MKAPILSWHAVKSGARALRHWDDVKSRALDPGLREQIILYVSAINGCAICTAVHAPRCPIGLPEDDRTRAAFAFAAARTRGEPEPSLALFRDDEARAIRAVVDLFTFNNRFNNTWERWLPGAAARREKLGL